MHRLIVWLTIALTLMVITGCGSQPKTYVVQDQYGNQGIITEATPDALDLEIAKKKKELELAQLQKQIERLTPQPTRTKVPTLADVVVATREANLTRTARPTAAPRSCETNREIADAIEAIIDGAYPGITAKNWSKPVLDSDITAEARAEVVPFLVSKGICSQHIAMPTATPKKFEPLQEIADCPDNAYDAAVLSDKQMNLNQNSDELTAMSERFKTIHSEAGKAVWEVLVETWKGNGTCK